jgi:hypothetical protein
MKQLFLLLSLVFYSLNIFSQDAFLSKWTGVWEGKLYIYSNGEIKDSIQSILTIAETNNPHEFTWKTVYKAPDKDIVKDYKMIAQDSIPNMYIMDENNGIELKAYRFGNKLYSVFAVQGSLLTSLYELKDNELIFEIISGKELDETENVTNYSVSFLQRAVFTKEE